MTPKLFKRYELDQSSFVHLDQLEYKITRYSKDKDYTYPDPSKASLIVVTS